MRIRSSLPAAALLVAALCVPGRAAHAQGTLDLVVAGTTDTHGRVRGWNYESDRVDNARGLARSATIVDSLRQSAPGRVILLDGGDLLQGNAFTYVAARVAPAGTKHPVIAAMNVMKYDAAAVGNHEFNYGLPFLDATIKQATFPFLGTNAYRVPTGKRAFGSYVIVERAGVRVGIVGATQPGSMVWDHDNLTGKLVIRDIVSELRTAVAEVRKAGADIVLVTMHSGLTGESSYDTVATKMPSENVAAKVAHDVPGIDLILYGHSHEEMPDTLINGVLLMQGKNWAQSVAVAHLMLAKESGHWRVTSRSSRVIQDAGHAESPAVLAVTDDAHRATLAWINRPIGKTTVAWRADSARVADTPLMDFILEVERKATNADLASTAAFSLDASIDSGTITAARLQALYPYDNTLRAVRITGKQLREYLEQSARYYVTGANGAVSVDPKIPGFNYDMVAGVDYTIDVSRPIGQRITKLEVRSRPVLPEDTFTMAVNNYRQTGGGGFSMLSGAPVVVDTKQEIRQLLVDEVEKRGTIAPVDYFHRNWHIEPASAVTSLYAQQRRNNREDAHAVGTSAKARPATKLRIIGTNDFHGALEARPDATGKRRGGAAYWATAIHNLSAGCVSPACETILLDGGDEFQGTPASNLAFGRPIVAVFNQLGFAAGALGNHEFDWGQDTLRARMRDAHYGILGANVRYADGRPVPWIRSDTLVTRGNLKIGVIGLATVATPSTTKASNVSDLRFLTPAPIVDSLSKRLRARGADYVIVITHEGAFCDRDGANNCKGEVVDLVNALHEPIDAVVSGHTHSLVDATIKGIPVVQARSSGTAVDMVELGPDGATHHVSDVLPDSLAADPVVAAIVADAANKVASLVNRPVATIAADMNRDGTQYALGNLIADAQRAAGHGDIGIMNNGGIRANLRAGAATYGTLFEIQPFGNVLYRVTVNGKALREYFERLVSKRLNVHISGATITYDSTKTAGSRMIAAKFSDGREIIDDAQYTVVFTDFLATGGDGLGLAASAIRTEPLSIIDLDALIDYLHARPQPVQAPADVRIIAVPAKP
jgi:2',3'-cyclic-nucleotide 2'-phosphodiesterase (5'-nucleotidase family)